MNSPQTDTSPASAAPADLAAVYDPMIRGTALGLLSALAYTAANIALRDLSRTEGVVWAMWISSVKAVPCFLASLVLVAFRRLKGLQALPPREKLLPLFAAAVLMQFGGNTAFAWSLSKVGLVLTIPLAFSTLISGSAILGRIFLGEPLNSRTLVSILLLLLSIICLSLAADSSFPDAAATTIVSGMLLAALAGFSYGTNSIVIRQFLGGQFSVSSMVLVMSTCGVFVLGSVSFALMGPERIANIEAAQWSSMAWAGIANAVAFFAVSSSLKYIPAVRANLLNASQTAMCAVAGVLLFQERMTPLLATGIGFTVAGLMLLGIRRAKQQPPHGLALDEAASLRE